MTWIPIEQQPMPKDVAILVTDGKHICLCEVMQFDMLTAVGVYGYDYELELHADSITHWMLAPELP